MNWANKSKLIKFASVVLIGFLVQNASFAEEKSEIARSHDSLRNEVENVATLLSTDPAAFNLKADIIEKYSLSIGDSVSYYKVRIYKGVYQAMQGNLDQSLKMFFDVHDYSKKTKDPMLELSALNNIAGVYRYSGNYPKAEEYMLKALGIWDDTEKYDVDRGQLLLSLGMVVDVQGRLTEAEDYLKEALDIFKVNSDYDLMLKTMAELGFILEKEEDLRQALGVYKSMISLYSYTNNRRSLTNIRQRLGSVYMKLGKYEEAYDELKIALSLGDSLNFDVQQDSTLVRLVKTTAQLGRISEMNSFLNQLSSFYQNHEIKNIEKTMSELEREHQLDQQQLENEILKTETEKQRLALENTRTLLFGGITALILLSILFITIFRYNKREKKLNEQLVKANLELEKNIEIKTEQLDSRNLQLLQTSFSLAHEIRAKVATILGATTLVDEQKADKQNLEMLEAIKESSKDLDEIVKDLIKKLE